ncbi:unnamed protein product [Closterium sp. NIES-65]|nr:unnamed protein product [Closterium sp. NIES-65]
MELAMTRAIGEAYTTNATRFREEGRQHLEVRFKFRHPGATKAQLDRSGDPGALARQARVVQRWINSSDVTRTDDCLGIGKVCIVGWKDIPEEELVADEHGDLDLDELVSEPGSQERDYDENEEQEELYG